MSRHWFKRLVWGILALLLILLVLPVVLLLVERVRGQISLAHYQRDLKARGEKLTARELAGPPVAEENGAPAALAAKKELVEGEILPKRYPPRMKMTPSGEAIVCFREVEWVEDGVTNRWEQVAADLATNAAVLGRIRIALAKPVLDNHVDLSLGPKLSFSHVAPVKALSYWFGAASQLALHEGRTREALGDLLVQIELPRLLAEDRLGISELVRIALAGIARASTWEALQAEGWTDEDLARLQAAWERQSFASGMVRGLEGELVYDLGCYDYLRDSNADTVAMFYAMEQFLPGSDVDRPAWEQAVRSLPGGDAAADFLKKQVYCQLWRFAWLDQDERRSLGINEQLLSIARTACTNQSWAAVEPAIARLGQGNAPANLYDKLRYPMPESPFTLTGLVSKAMRVETERSLVLCAIALKRYSLKYHKLPESLDTLVPEFLHTVPVDYMDGKPVRYRLKVDGNYLLYSVGADGKDDGGDSRLSAGKTNARVYWDRRDFVWPTPAANL